MDWQGIWVLAQPILAAQLRHVLSGAAAALVAKGALQSDQTGSFVQIGVGFAGYVAVAGWSWWRETGQSKFIAALAKLHPVASSKDSTATAVEAAKEAVKGAPTA